MFNTLKNLVVVKTAKRATSTRGRKAYQKKQKY
jgi:hypothetical protein